MKMKPLILFLITASLTLSAFGQLSNYQKARNMTVLADKKRFVLSLSHEDQVKVWRPHFAYVTITEDLTAEQQEYLLRSLRAFETGDLTDELDREAKDLFDRDLGRRVFNPGEFTTIGSMCRVESITREIRETTLKRSAGFTFAPVANFRGKGSSVADCNCGQTSTNWGCDGSCLASSCTPTPDGCSIFYMYPCNGKCSTGSEEPEDPPEGE